MKQLVTAGFGDPLPPKFVDPVRGVATGIRTGPAVNDEHDRVAAIVKDAKKNFDDSIFIIGGWDWRLPDGSLEQRRGANLLENPGKEHLSNQCNDVVAVWRQNGGDLSRLWIEIGNELDGSYWKRNIDEFHELAMHCYDRVRSLSADVKFVTGSTMNFNKGLLWKDEGYEILEDICRTGWPADTYQGLHPYRGDEGLGWPSFDDTEDAQFALRRMLKGRKVAITEMGWSSGGNWTDEQIADFMRVEVKDWERFDAGCFVSYQIQDGKKPHNTGEGGFGAYINHEDGLDPKPVKFALEDSL